MSANHNGDYDLAVRLVHAAKEAGADAVKIQTYTADSLTLRSDAEPFRIRGGTLWDGRTLHELYAQAATPYDWQPKLKEIADRIGLTLFSSAFDAAGVEFLERMNVPAHKLASFEVVDLELIERMARTGKPLIMSTGMATMDEIDLAVATARKAGATQLALMKCTSAYPAPPEDMNLGALRILADRFRIPVGLSDHTLGTVMPAAAVALGASLIEKHFTLDRKIPTADGAFSLEPAEFKTMVEAVRTVEKAVASSELGTTPSEERSRIFRRSLFTTRAVKRGEEFTRDNVRSIRPGTGLPPKHLPEILGKRAAADLGPGTPLDWNLIS
jgi:N-acetylneuraminate synthase